MIRIFLTTLITSVISVFLIGLYVVIVGKSFGTGLYFIVLAYGNIAIPNLLSVIIYAWMWNVLKHMSFWKRTVISIIIAGAAMQLMLFAYIALDIVQHSGLENLTFVKMQDEFDAEYSGYEIFATILMISIPLTYKLLENWLKTANLHPISKLD